MVKVKEKKYIFYVSDIYITQKFLDKIINFLDIYFRMYKHIEIKQLIKQIN